jgi:hypothetical protein
MPAPGCVFLRGVDAFKCKAGIIGQEARQHVCFGLSPHAHNTNSTCTAVQETVFGLCGSGIFCREILIYASLACSGTQVEP